MPRYTTEAVVIGIKPFGDADRIITMFTRERGKVRAAAFGSRRPKSLLGSLQLFAHVEATLSEGNNLDTLRSFSAIGHGAFADDIKIVAYASFVAELIDELFPENQADNAAFDLAVAVFNAFTEKNPRVTALIAAWQLLMASGVSLELTTCVKCGTAPRDDAKLNFGEGGIVCKNCDTVDGIDVPLDVRNFVTGLRRYDWDSPTTMRITRRQLLGAERILLPYLRFFLGKELNSLGFIAALVPYASS